MSLAIIATYLAMPKNLQKQLGSEKSGENLAIFEMIGACKIV